MSESRAPKKIVIQSSGTRGDAQPMAALALKLQDEGFDVTMFTNLNEVSFCESVGLRARGIFLDFEEQLKKPKYVEAMATGDPHILKDARTEGFVQTAGPTTKRWMEAVTEIMPDLCLSGSLADALGMVMVRHFKIPVITVQLQPLPPNPPKMIMGFPNLCCFNRCLMTYLMRQVVQGELDAYVPEFKKQYNINLASLFTNQEIIEARTNPPDVMRILMGADPTFCQVLYGGKDSVPKTVRLLGSFSIDSDKQVKVVKKGEGEGEVEVKRQKSNQFGEQSDLELIDDFCVKDPLRQPVYLGFGSMVAKSPEHMVVLMCQAVQKAGARGLIGKGWAKLSQTLLEKSTKDSALIEYAKNNIMFVGNSPHEWLFPKCSCIVHHGGAGTTSTASRAGVPQVILPVFMDQWDFSSFLNSYGSGFGSSKQLSKVSAQELGDAIKKVTSDEKMKAKAKEWKTNVLAQPGTKGACEEMRAWWDAEVVTGKFAKYHDDQMKAIKK